MTLAALTPEEREVVRRSMQATFRLFDFDFQTRLGVEPERIRPLLAAWPPDESSDHSDACLAVNNSLNDLLCGEAITEAEASELVGATRAEMEHVYKKWASARGWNARGVL